MSGKSLGQIAYDAWRGRYWGRWESLAEEDKPLWEASARAVLDAQGPPVSIDDALTKAREAVVEAAKVWLGEQRQYGSPLGWESEKWLARAVKALEELEKNV
jgi:hypothetical protein